MTQLDWILLAVLTAVYLATAVRAAMAAGRLGRSPIRWLAITICFTAIPAMIVFYRDMQRRQRAMAHRDTPARTPHGSVIRCPNCRAMIDPAELAEMPVKVCPRCHLHIEKVDLA